MGHCCYGNAEILGEILLPAIRIWQLAVHSCASARSEMSEPYGKYGPCLLLRGSPVCQYCVAWSENTRCSVRNTWGPGQYYLFFRFPSAPITSADRLLKSPSLPSLNSLLPSDPVSKHGARYRFKLPNINREQKPDFATYRERWPGTAWFE